ncbi:hypothetical protein FZEAL_9211 [Fusarium zealandicum]|uniref:WSC domain-containing protein n=1 Tax=Fusarium zealandicum TaxID=1053134 RepID=A0A8H4XG32_9HYPO|nr:hypothetical protein FZEAL_9211 [Fusarium zealandicum]
MWFPNPSLIVASATLFSLCASFSISPSDDADVLANAIFSGPGTNVVSASFTGASISSGTFADGPFGIGARAILTTTSEETTTVTEETTTTTTEESTTTTTEDSTATTTEESTTTTTEDTTITTSGESTTISTSEDSTSTSISVVTEESTTTTASTRTLDSTSTSAESTSAMSGTTTSSSVEFGTSTSEVTSTSTQETSTESTSKTSLETAITSQTESSSQALTLQPTFTTPSVSSTSDLVRSSTSQTTGGSTSRSDSPTASSSSFELPVDLPSSQASVITLLPTLQPSAIDSTASPLFPTGRFSNTSSTLPTLTSTSITPIAPGAASNLPVIEQYRYLGCLGSLEGYPSFRLLGSSPDMTTVQCIALAAGQRFVGLFQTSCYVSNTLDSTSFVLNGRCDFPCPGDEGLFCGGFVSPEETLARRSERFQDISPRDAPPDILLSLYGLAASEPESSSGTGSIGVSSDTPDQTSGSEPGGTLRTSTSLETNGPIELPGTPGAIPTFTSDAIGNPSIGSLTETGTLTASSESHSRLSRTNSNIRLSSISSFSLITAALPDANSPLPSDVTAVDALTAATASIQTIVTTVVYTIVDPHNPSYLTVAEFCTTLEYSPCDQCKTQITPQVEMSTILTTCDACGYRGEKTITLTVPMGAITTSEAVNGSPLGANPNLEAGPVETPQGEVSILDFYSTVADAHSEPTGLSVEHDSTKAKGPDADNQAAVSEHEGALTEDEKPHMPDGGDGRPVNGDDTAAGWVGDGNGPYETDQPLDKEHTKTPAADDKTPQAPNEPDNQNPSVEALSSLPLAEPTRGGSSPTPARGAEKLSTHTTSATGRGSNPTLVGGAQESKLRTTSISGWMPPTTPVVVTALGVRNCIEEALLYVAVVVGLYFAL